jgi:putative SOS response-associated peptidase YedK
MCSNYNAVTEPDRLRMHFGVEAPPSIKSSVWPLYEAPFIRRHPHADVGDDAVPAREALSGRFGLIPHWAGELNFGRRTYNARSETVAEKPSFRDAWKNAQHCLVPAEWIYEPDWRSGRAVPTRIQRKDNKPMGIAGLWTSNRKATGEEVLSFTMLTVNADGHALFQHFHKPQDEKRMVVILPEERYDAWLDAPVACSADFMRHFPATLLMASAEEDRGKRPASGA